MNINRINKVLFRRLIGLTHWLTETEARSRIGTPVLRALAGLTLVVKQGQPQPSVAEAASEWQRMFPSRKMVPITRIDGDVVHAEIHSPCPYRGSGNVAGCHRMMEYDRKLMGQIGAEFVVVESQAEPGVTHCKVAMGRIRDQLPPAAKDRLARG